MKHLVAFFILILTLSMLSSVASAQTITLGSVQTTYCQDKQDTLVIPYHASGAFSSDNYFMVHLSDSKGSFTDYKIVGNDTSHDGEIRIPHYLGGMRVMVTSLEPYAYSDTSAPIAIVPQSNPAIWAWRSSNTDYYGNSQVGSPFNTTPFEGANLTSPSAGLVGDTLIFTPPPFDQEAPQTVYTWNFPSDALVLQSVDSEATVVFPQAGFNAVSLSVSSPTTCDGGTKWRFYVPSTHPQIPSNARVITSEMGKVEGMATDSVVWVKPGGTFSTPYINCVSFVEPGGSASGGRLIYFRPDSGNFVWTRQPEITVHDTTPGMSIDTFYVQNLTFDYSQVEASVPENPSHSLTAYQSGNHFIVRSAADPIDARIVNLLGRELSSGRSTGMLDLDLTSLPDGVYFAIVQSGTTRMLQKVLIVP